MLFHQKSTTMNKIENCSCSEIVKNHNCTYLTSATNDLSYII